MIGLNLYCRSVYHLSIDNKDIQLFSQNLINVSLEYSQSIRKAIRHNLVFEIAILDLESGFPLITFTNPHSMIGIGKIQLG